MPKRKIALIAASVVLLACIGLTAAGLNSWIQTVGIMSAGYVLGGFAMKHGD